MAPSISDDTILDLSNQQGALLITADKDFGELVYRQRRVAAGVLLVRLAGLSPEARGRTTAAAVRQRGPELAGAFTVISPGRIRIRRRH
jgi:predicted nuclease of predicted toxin-antitoxin system